MRLGNFVIATGDVSNDPNNTKPKTLAGSGKRITISSAEIGMGNLMNIAGGTMTINDGSSDRVLTFDFSSAADNVINVSSGGPLGSGTDAGEQHIADKINGSTGGAVNVTASNVNDSSTNVIVDLTHDLGGTITISFNQGSASAIGSTYLVVSDTGGGGSTIEVRGGDDFVTGSLNSSGIISGKAFGKVTLRQGKIMSGSLPSLGSSFNTMIREGDITQQGDFFHFTGSLSGASDPNSNESRAIIGDALVIGKGA